MIHIVHEFPDIHRVCKLLLTNGMKLTEETQINRAPKGQQNFYDSERTRIQLLAFTRVEKPRCSGYTGPHRKP